jgi:rRNA maturation endonuclease Nob1
MKIVNLRVCASCKWIFELKHYKACPKCGFGHYRAHYVYDKKCYKYKLTQESWIE